MRDVTFATRRFSGPKADAVASKRPYGFTTDKLTYSPKDIAHLLVEALPAEALTAEVIEFLAEAVSFYKRAQEAPPPPQKRKLRGKITRRYERPALTLDGE